MGRTIKLLLYFFAYQLAFMGVAICGYMWYRHTFELPKTPDALYTNLIMLAQVLSTAALGIHLLAGKYVGLDRKTWGYHCSPKLLITSAVFILAMGLWTNYFNELADLPNNMEAAFDMMMHHPLGIVAIVIMAPLVEELLFRGAFQGLMRPCGSAAAIFAPALLFGVLHLDLAQGLTAFACGVFLGWLAERSGSILPGMLLHLVNNALAFLTIYLRYYAPAEVSFGVELFILLFFPAFGAWMICNARRQGFSFSAGLRPGVDVLTVFTSPVYCATVLFLVAYAAIFVH